MNLDTSRPLFTLTVRHDEAGGLESPAHAEGQPVGRGTGDAAGQVLSGPVRWTLSERVGEGLCAMDVFVVVDTEDGAAVHLEGQGFARLRDAQSARWEVAGAMHASSDDPRYAWLTDQLLGWDGDADLARGEATWRAWLRPRGVTSGGEGSAPPRSDRGRGRARER